MKGILKKSEFFEYQFQNKKKSYNNVYVFYVTFEIDDTPLDFQDLLKRINHYIANNPLPIILFPYVHLYECKANQKTSEKLYYQIKKKFTDIDYVPFGTKKYYIEKVLDEHFFKSNFIVNRIKQTPKYYKYFNNKYELIKFQESSYTQSNMVLEQNLKKYDIVESLNIFDKGNYIYKNNGTIVFKILKNLIRQNIVNKIENIQEISASSIYSTNSPYIKEWLNLFPERQYRVNNNNILKFSACPEMFALYKTKKHYKKNLPFFYFEFANCYRYEQKGELKPFRRSRFFVMPDIHGFFKNDYLEVIVEIKKLLKLYLEFYKLLGITRYNLVFETTTGFYNEYNKYFQDLGKIIYRVFARQDHYFVLKIEIRLYTTAQNTIQVGTLQIDNQNSNKFNLEYNTTQKTKQKPLILHTSPGSLERIFNIVYSNTKIIDRILPITLYIINLDSNQQIIEGLKQYYRILDDQRTCNLGEKIKNFYKNTQIPYYTVIGHKEKNLQYIKIYNRARKQIKINQNILCSYEKFYKRFVA